MIFSNVFPHVNHTRHTFSNHCRVLNGLPSNDAAWFTSFLFCCPCFTNATEHSCVAHLCGCTKPRFLFPATCPLHPPWFVSSRTTLSHGSCPHEPLFHMARVLTIHS